VGVCIVAALTEAERPCQAEPGVQSVSAVCSQVAELERTAIFLLLRFNSCPASLCHRRPHSLPRSSPHSFASTNPPLTLSRYVPIHLLYPSQPVFRPPRQLRECGLADADCWAPPAFLDLLCAVQTASGHWLVQKHPLCQSARPAPLSAAFLRAGTPSNKEMLIAICARASCIRIQSPTLHTEASSRRPGDYCFGYIRLSTLSSDSPPSDCWSVGQSFLSNS
jgi:hypothetical protein